MRTPPYGEAVMVGHLQGELLGEAAMAGHPGETRVHWRLQQPGQLVAGTHTHPQNQSM